MKNLMVNYKLHIATMVLVLCTMVVIMSFSSAFAKYDNSEAVEPVMEQRAEQSGNTVDILNDYIKQGAGVKQFQNYTLRNGVWDSSSTDPNKPTRITTLTTKFDPNVKDSSGKSYDTEIRFDFDNQGQGPETYWSLPASGQPGPDNIAWYLRVGWESELNRNVIYAPGAYKVMHGDSMNGEPPTGSAQHPGVVVHKRAGSYGCWGWHQSAICGTAVIPARQPVIHAPTTWDFDANGVFSISHDYYYYNIDDNGDELIPKKQHSFSGTPVTWEVEVCHLNIQPTGPVGTITLGNYTYTCGDQVITDATRPSSEQGKMIAIHFFEEGTSWKVNEYWYFEKNEGLVGMYIHIHAKGANPEKKMFLDLIN